MREALLVMPAQDNQGQSLNPLLNDLAGTLVESFGGFTVIDAQGGWSGPNGRPYIEPIHVFTIAMAPDEKNNARLRQIADTFGRAARQLSVYVRFADGTVEILDLVPQPLKKAS